MLSAGSHCRAMRSRACLPEPKGRGQPSERARRDRPRRAVGEGVLGWRERRRGPRVGGDARQIRSGRARRSSGRPRARRGRRASGIGFGGWPRPSAGPPADSAGTGRRSAWPMSRRGRARADVPAAAGRCGRWLGQPRGPGRRRAQGCLRSRCRWPRPRDEWPGRRPGERAGRWRRAGERRGYGQVGQKRSAGTRKLGMSVFTKSGRT